MSIQHIYVTSNDQTKLINLIIEAQRTEYRGSPYLQLLHQELNRATVLPSTEIPHDVITMGTTAILMDLDSKEEMDYTLVYPDEANPMEGKISILAPIGTAMLGYRVGDEFTWDTPDGPARIRVIKILFQPEASGDFD